MTSRLRRTSLLLVLSALTLAALASPGAASAASCAAGPGGVPSETSWAAPTNGNWEDAANWTNGTPSNSCHTSITAAGTYTVILSGSGEGTAGLTLGGTSGTQTLQVTGTTKGDGSAQQGFLSTDASSQTSSIGTHGVLTLTSTGSNPGAAILGGVISNSGLIRTDQGAPGPNSFRDIRANLTNNASGTIALHANTTTCGCGAGGTWINNGSITTDAGTSSELSRTGAGFSFTQAAGTITNNGSLLVAGTTTHTGGNTTGNPIKVCNNLNATGPGTASFDLVGSSADTTFCGSPFIAGDIGPGDTVRARTDSGTTLDVFTTNAAPDITNKGSLTLGGGGGLVQFHGSQTGKLTNTGTLGFGSGTTNMSIGLVNSATTNLPAGSVVNFGSPITQMAGTISVGATASLNASTLTESGGTVANSGIVASDTVTHTGGGSSGNPINVCSTLTPTGPGTASFDLGRRANVCPGTNFTLASNIGTGDTVRVRADSGTIDVFTTNAAPDITNRGSLTLGGGGGLVQVHGGSLTNDGTLGFGAGSTNMAIQLVNNATASVPTGSTANFGGSTSQAAGKLTVDGSFNNSSGLPITGGTVQGTGTINASSGPGVTNSAGTVHPGHSPGILSIVGDYTQGSGGTLAVDVTGAAPGTGYSRLAVSGNASLSGALRVTTPASQTGDFRVLTAGALTGTFAPVTFVGQTDSVAYDTTGVTLTGASPDTTPPKLRITKKPKAKIKTKSRKVKISVSFKSEPGVKFTCEVDRGPYKKCASPFSVRVKSSTGKGKKHTIKIKATDKAGNSSRAELVSTKVIRTTRKK